MTGRESERQGGLKARRMRGRKEERQAEGAEGFLAAKKKYEWKLCFAIDPLHLITQLTSSDVPKLVKLIARWKLSR